MTYRTLISTTELAAQLGDPKWRVVDCRFTLSDPDAGRRKFDLAHIPGAVYFHLENDLSGPITEDSGRHPLPNPKTLAEKLGQAGINNKTQVVAYDDSFGAIAARLWWLLRWLGHEACAVLDGDIRKWGREGLPMTDHPTVVGPTQFHPSLNAKLWVESDHVESLLSSSNELIIDARAEERFNGEVEPLDKVAGHVPGAVNLPYEDNLAESGEFLAPDELRRLYEKKLAGRAAAEIVQMCGSGVTACHNLLAMEHAGLTGARLYAGSWSEWITNPKRPVTVGSS